MCEIKLSLQDEGVMQKIDHNYFSLGARESFSVCVPAHGRVNVMASVINLYPQNRAQV